MCSPGVAYSQRVVNITKYTYARRTIKYIQIYSGWGSGKNHAVFYMHFFFFRPFFFCCARLFHRFRLNEKPYEMLVGGQIFGRWPQSATRAAAVAASAAVAARPTAKKRAYAQAHTSAHRHTRTPFYSYFPDFYFYNEQKMLEILFKYSDIPNTNYARAIRNCFCIFLMDFFSFGFCPAWMWIFYSRPASCIWTFRMD